MENLHWQIESKKEQILVLEELATNTSPSLTGMPHNPSKTKSRMADAVCKIVDLENSIKEDEAEIEKLKQRLAKAIDQVEAPLFRTILYKRFFQSKSSDTIAEEIFYSKRQTYRFFQEATTALEKALSRQK